LLFARCDHVVVADRGPAVLVELGVVEQRAARSARRAVVDLVGELDASPAGLFQTLEHVGVTCGQGGVIAPVGAKPLRWL
jgi:hypothetical protein